VSVRTPRTWPSRSPPDTEEAEKLACSGAPGVVGESQFRALEASGRGV
jgi:hypothetical protein